MIGAADLPPPLNLKALWMNVMLVLIQTRHAAGPNRELDRSSSMIILDVRPRARGPEIDWLFLVRHFLIKSWTSRRAQLDRLSILSVFPSTLMAWIVVHSLRLMISSSLTKSWVRLS